MKPSTLLEYLRAPDAEQHLKHYYSGCYAGGTWDQLVASLDADSISVADVGLTALLGLGATLRGRYGRASAASIVKLSDHQAAITRELEALKPDRDLAEIDDDEFNTYLGSGNTPVGRLWQTLRNELEWGPVLAYKVLAGKRPRLLPIRDKVLSDALGRQDEWYRPWWKALRGSAGLRSRLDVLVGVVPGSISPLRAADVVIWMTNYGANQPHTCTFNRSLPGP